jgi:HSP20 family molecular chaperone IbpA
MTLARLDRLFDDLVAPSWSIPYRAYDYGFTESEKEYRFTLDIPGFETTDIEINLDGRKLSIKAQNQDRTTSRIYTMPIEVDTDKTQAEMKNGVLKIILPKINKSRKIEIK